MTQADLGFIHRLDRGTGGTTLLLLHGTGGDEDDLLSLGRAVAPEATLLSPRGQVVEGGMPRFFKRLAMGVFDVPDLIARSADLGRFVSSAADEYDLDPGRVYALGYSNGANIAAAMLLLHPEILAGAALLHAMVPLEPAQPPDLTGKPVLITGGRRDPMIPGEQTEALASMLAACGAEVSLELQPGGHELTPAELQSVQGWTAKELA